MATITQSIDRQTFFARLRESGLLSESEITALDETLPPGNRGKLIARALVQDDILTRFQAERLLAGRTQGFHLDQYVILDELGQGGMGRVFKARHRTMDRVVALKLLWTRVLETERAQTLFAREVQAAAQLVHPNIVTAFDANQTEEHHYLVMEFIDGPNLEQLVKDKGPLPVELACEYIRQAALGLDCAHQRDMVHRDIKPANILLHRNETIKISDFGLARLQAPSSQTGKNETILSRPNTVMGTPDFLSPEQARDLHNTDIRSDLYSLGATFYYLLTGQVLFPGGTAMEKLIRHSSEVPERVSARRSEVPPEVDAIVARLLEKHPEDRFQTPQELIDALNPLIPVKTEPVEMEEVTETREATEVQRIEELQLELVTVPETPSPVTPLATPVVMQNPLHREREQAQMKKALLISVFIVGGLLLTALLAAIFS